MPHSIHSAGHAPWEAHISNIKTQMRVGIYPHETNAQTIVVSAIIRGHYPACPRDISECMNYEVLQDLVMKRWPAYPQVLLLETLVMECFDEIFQSCTLAYEATVSIKKPDIFCETEAVGVSLTLQKSHYLQLKHGHS